MCFLTAEMVFLLCVALAQCLLAIYVEHVHMHLTEYRSRVGCHHSRAITPKTSKHKSLLSVGEAYILMLVLCYGNIGTLIALLTIVTG